MSRKYNDDRRFQTLTHTMFLLAFGLGALALCVAIDRPHWFRIRPVSGTAHAMSLASDSAPEDRQAPMRGEQPER